MPTSLLRLLRKGFLYSSSLNISYIAIRYYRWCAGFPVVVSFDGRVGGVKVVIRSITVGLKHLCTQSK